MIPRVMRTTTRVYPMGHLTGGRKECIALERDDPANQKIANPNTSCHNLQNYS